MNSLSRRRFLKVVTTVCVVTGIAPATFIVGCAVDPKQLLSTIVLQVQAILKVATPGSSWAINLQNALTALQGAIQNFNSTNTVTVIDSALNAVMAVLSVIPTTEIYAPLIAVLVAGIETVLNLLVPSSPVTAARRMARPNPYEGRVQLRKPHMFQSQLGAYKSQWNDTASEVGLPQARI